MFIHCKIYDTKSAQHPGVAFRIEHIFSWLKLYTSSGMELESTLCVSFSPRHRVTVEKRRRKTIHESRHESSCCFSADFHHFAKFILGYDYEWTWFTIKEAKREMTSSELEALSFESMMHIVKWILATVVCFYWNWSVVQISRYSIRLHVIRS